MARAGLLILCGLLLSGCELFAPRTPAPPDAEGGTYVQPDTPEQVVENLRNAIRELNAPNYRRGFAAGFVFEPTAAAAARDPNLWAGWGIENEVSYFSALVAAAQASGDHRLELTDQAAPEITETRYVLDATYRLMVDHRRTDVPTTVEGSLRWEIVRGEDGLWRIQAWYDRTLGNAPSWSDLKAEFVK